MPIKHFELSYRREVTIKRKLIISVNVGQPFLQKSEQVSFHN